MSSTASGSTPAKGSSSKTNFGSVAKARAISVLRLCPPDNKSPLVFLISLNPNSFSNNSILLFCCFFVSFVSSKTPLKFSSTVSFLKTDASCDK